jgi:radical SAM-linked protein
VEFSKTGRLKYLSHLELVTVLHRAIRKAGFPLEYSTGFHPSPKISFGPPLGVGIAGLSEYFDMEIAPPFDLITNRIKLNTMLPEGVCVKETSVIPVKVESLSSFITRYEYEIKGGDQSGIYRFLSEKEMNIQRGKYVINLRAMIEEARLTDKDTINLIVVDQGETKVRLGELLPVLFNTPLERLDIKRVALYGWDGGWVMPLKKCKMPAADCKV